MKSTTKTKLLRINLLQFLSQFGRYSIDICHNPNRHMLINIIQRHEL